MAEATPERKPRNFAGFGGAIASMQVTAYRNYTIANTLSLTGTWLQKLAMSWLVWQLTQSPSWLGIFIFADLITVITVSPVMGAIADRMDRLKLMMVAQFIMMGQATLLFGLYAFDMANIWVLLAMQVWQSFGQGTHTASRMALIPNLVPKHLLAPAIGVNAMTYNVARFLGPAVAGFVISQWGQLPAFALNALSYIPFMLILRTITIATPDDIRKPQGGILAQMAEGMRYAARHPGIGPLIFIMGIVSFSVRALPDMLPGFASDVFGRGVDGLAWFTSAMGLGAAGAGLMLARTNGTRGLTRRLAGNVACMALAVLAFVATRDFAIGVAAAAICGYVITTNGATSQTLIQSAVDGAMRGRVMTTFTLIYLGAPALGGLVFGHAAELIGLRLTFALGAGLCFLCFLWMFPRRKAMGDALEVGPAAGKAERP
ncbi:MAG TPA: MFS transporter [Alphaproteobacteria bacterium]|nr:MFS transporter [Alphaproteobacteria bacterium]